MGSYYLFFLLCWIQFILRVLVEILIFIYLKMWNCMVKRRRSRRGEKGQIEV
jgi:hypothetical protein